MAPAATCGTGRRSFPNHTNEPRQRALRSTTGVQLFEAPRPRAHRVPCARRRELGSMEPRGGPRALGVRCEHPSPADSLVSSAFPGHQRHQPDGTA